MLLPGLQESGLLQREGGRAVECGCYWFRVNPTVVKKTLIRSFCWSSILVLARHGGCVLLPGRLQERPLQGAGRLAWG